MGFISMYNSQEGVAFSDVQVKSFFRLYGDKARGGTVAGRGEPMGGMVRAPAAPWRGGHRTAHTVFIYYTSVFGLGRFRRELSLSAVP